MPARLALTAEAALLRLLRRREQNRLAQQRHRWRVERARQADAMSALPVSLTGQPDGAPARTAPPAGADNARDKDVFVVVAKQLMALGITERVAVALVERYGVEAVAQQLAWLPQRRVSRPAGAVVRAIQDEWAAPASAPSRVQVTSHGRNGGPPHETAPALPVFTAEQDAASAAARERVRAELQARGIVHRYDQIGAVNR